MGRGRTRTGLSAPRSNGIRGSRNTSCAIPITLSAPDDRTARAEISDRYLLPVRGGERYKVWGRKGSAARIELQPYSREPYGGEDVGVGYLPDEQIQYNVDGTTVELGPEVQEIHTVPAEATILNVRQIYDEWVDQDPGAVFVDRVGWEGARRMADNPAASAERWRAVAADIQSSIRCWPELVENGILTFLEPNTLSPLMSPGEKAGVVGRWMAIGHFALGPEDAVLIDMPPSGAPYEGAQLADLWFGSLEYASATSSISGTQAVTAPDGHRYLVLSLEDPGYTTWLDPAVLFGELRLRYDGLAERPARRRRCCRPSRRARRAHPRRRRLCRSSGPGSSAMRRRHVQVRAGGDTGAMPRCRQTLISARPTPFFPPRERFGSDSTSSAKCQMTCCSSVSNSLCKRRLARTARGGGGWWFATRRRRPDSPTSTDALEVSISPLPRRQLQRSRSPGGSWIPPTSSPKISSVFR